MKKLMIIGICTALVSFVSIAATAETTDPYSDPYYEPYGSDSGVIDSTYDSTTEETTQSNTDMYSDIESMTTDSTTTTTSGPYSFPESNSALDAWNNGSDAYRVGFKHGFVAGFFYGDLTPPDWTGTDVEEKNTGYRKGYSFGGQIRARADGILSGIDELHDQVWGGSGYTAWGYYLDIERYINITSSPNMADQAQSEATEAQAVAATVISLATSLGRDEIVEEAQTLVNDATRGAQDCRDNCNAYVNEFTNTTKPLADSISAKQRYAHETLARALGDAVRAFQNGGTLTDLNNILDALEEINDKYKAMEAEVKAYKASHERLEQYWQDAEGAACGVNTSLERLNELLVFLRQLQEEESYYSDPDYMT